MKVTLNTIKEAISDSKTKIVSFDVFDTLIVRPFWLPTDLFYFLNRELEHKYDISAIINFSNIRIEAESMAREKAISSGREDVTLEEIYEQINDLGIFDKQVVRELMQKEMELELRFCIARTSARKLVEHAVKEGKQVIAVSDMYLPSDFIQKLLINSGFQGIEKVFVSCEAGVSKWTGHLYDYVVEEYGVEHTNIVHIGDNLKSDVRIPRKLGVRAFPYYRPVDMLSGENGIPLGKAYKKAYKQLRSPFSNRSGMDNIGTRCLLAVAANRVYDNPFRNNSGCGDFGYDLELFGNFALGTYSMTQAMWLNELCREEGIDRVLFFARDGYLPFIGFQMIHNGKSINTSQRQEVKDNSGCAAHTGVIESVYVRTSRKALTPLLMVSKELCITAPTHIRYFSQSPKTIVRLMKPVLKEETSLLESVKGDAWNKAFRNDSSMLQFLLLLYEKYVDTEKMTNYLNGYKSYFSKYMRGKILTYDIGYNLRNESLLRYFFPDADITASCTHIGDDVAIRRSKQSGIPIHRFYPSVPYVSYLTREMFMIENEASCVGYSSEGKPILEYEEMPQTLLEGMHNQAIEYMKEFVEIFKEDIDWLPTEYIDACFPFESLLHSPNGKEKKWIKQLYAKDSIDTGVKDFKSYNFWREERTDYWIAKHHLGKYGRHVVRFIMLTYTDREELKQLIKKRVPEKILKRIRI